MRMYKKLPIGIENFEKMRTHDFYYIDKTGLIKELLHGCSAVISLACKGEITNVKSEKFIFHSGGEVNLFTRPRRFGKSLTMNMLKSFFEIGCKKELFDGLDIANESELCEKYMGKFPVISISLKGVSGNNFETARALMCSIIGEEASKFQFLSDSSKLSDMEKERYNKLITVGARDQGNFSMSDDVLMTSLRVLSNLLQKHYDQKVIILIDEYDVPLAKAFHYGYYIRWLF